jgi:hypothetical protein
MPSTPTPLSLTSVFFPTAAEPAELTAAHELAKLTGARATAGTGKGVSVALASRGRPAKLPTKAADTTAWMWLRIAEDGTGEISATHGSFLFAAVRLLANSPSDFTREKLAAGVLLPATFGWHRPHWDACLTQYWRSARNFDPSTTSPRSPRPASRIARSTACRRTCRSRISSPHEYYPQFYTYAPGFNHFVDTADQGACGRRTTSTPTSPTSSNSPTSAAVTA